MPVPSEYRKRVEASHRLMVMLRTTELALREATSICQEVMGPDLSILRLRPIMIQACCSHLLGNNIKLKHDEYEPHAMYMHAFMLGFLKMLKPCMITAMDPLGQGNN